MMFQSRAARHALFWLLAAAVFMFLLNAFSTIIQPFVLALILAYLLDPVADRLETWRIPRWAAALIVLLGFAALLVCMLLMFAPLISAQLIDLAKSIPAIVATLTDKLKLLLDSHLGAYLPAELQEAKDVTQVVTDLGPQIGSLAQSIAGRLLGAGQHVFDVISLLVITPVVAFYVLRDWDLIVASFHNLLPKGSAGAIREQLGLVDNALSGFLRGQVLVCLALGLFYAVTLTLSGLNFGFIIGLIAGLVTFIPYLGSIIGLGLSLVVAISQWDEPLPIVIVAVIFFVGQFLEGNIMTPKLVGDRVGLHPAWIMFALMAGGSLFGFLGVMIAVPVAAAIGILIRFLIGQYLKSEFHLNSNADKS